MKCMKTPGCDILSPKTNSDEYLSEMQFMYQQSIHYT